MNNLPGQEGYRGCHVCSITKRMEARQSFHCTGRLDLAGLLLLDLEKRWCR